MFIIFNHEKLEARINEMYGDMVAFGKLLGMTKQRINSRLKGATEFTATEIEKAADLLKIDPVEIHKYFFEPKVIRR
ncbi:DUF739 family protein [Clostridiisalibacter paucivorans]|uniref:DUF739 family protein n=1 Tax=Clostridiisalibacter paucivorans TaxID=408753 RepID=UPI0005574734|nr:DUF739 family protein [Clostridiisalibacter paucivorans]